MLPAVLFSWRSHIVNGSYMNCIRGYLIIWNSFKSQLQSVLVMHARTWSKLYSIRPKINLACYFNQCTSLAPTISSGRVSPSFLTWLLLALSNAHSFFFWGKGWTSGPHTSSQCHLWYLQTSVRPLPYLDHLSAKLLSPILISCSVSLTMLVDLFPDVTFGRGTKAVHSVEDAGEPVVFLFFFLSWCLIRPRYGLKWLK